MPNEALARNQPSPDRPDVHEDVFRFGEGGRLVGVLTLPDSIAGNAESPVFLLMNAGLLHRVGPRRLHVDLARTLARQGFPSLRVDLSGIGDSPARIGVAGPEQLDTDLREVLTAVRSRLGRRPLVVAGLCAGADSAIAMTLIDRSDVAGLVLLDPMCYPDRWFRARSLLRAAWERVAHPVYHAVLFVRHVKMFAAGQRPVDQLSLRDYPTIEQTRSAFTTVRSRGGKVLSVFTRYSLIYYNRQGQLGRVLGINDYDTFCTELFLPHVNHIFPLEIHRRRLIAHIDAWASSLLPPADGPR